MKIRRILIFIACLVFNNGCSGLLYNPDRPTALFLNDYNIKPPKTPKAFMSCHHYNCNGIGKIQLSTVQWDKIKNLFSQPAENAASERALIAKAVALMETFAGSQNHTFADQACNNFSQPIESYQLDCIAETVNTTVYLLLMEKQQLLRWHRVRHPANRSVAFIFYPHSSAVIKELANKDLYAVDSWFYANGKEPAIVPLPVWRNNYYPQPCH